MNFHLRPYNQYILNIVTNIYLGLDFCGKIAKIPSKNKKTKKSKKRLAKVEDRWYYR